MNMHSANRQVHPGLLAFLAILTLTTRHAQASCGTTWIGGVDSNFGTAGNWSTGTVPGGGTDVCITATTATNPAAVADTYTVILNGSFTVRSLTLGGSTGTQTLVLPAAGHTFSLGTDSTIAGHGVLTMGDSGSGLSVLAGSGTLSNSGHANTVAGGAAAGSCASTSTTPPRAPSTSEPPPTKITAAP